MSYLYFLFVYAGPFVLASIIYLLWAYTKYRNQKSRP